MFIVLIFTRFDEDKLKLITYQGASLAKLGVYHGYLDNLCNSFE